MTTQRTVFAASQADLIYVLTQAGVLHAGQPVTGMGWEYKGQWSVGGATMASVSALIWWSLPPADAAEEQSRQAILAQLRAAQALYEGQEPPVYLMGTSGPHRPSDYELIGLLRDARKYQSGYKVGQHWYHSDPGSRTQQLGLVLAGQAGLIPQGLQWKTMSGAFVPMTAQLAQQIFGAAMTSDAQYHAIGEQARAALAAGTLTDVHAIQWPAGFGDQP